MTRAGAFGILSPAMRLWDTRAIRPDCCIGFNEPREPGLLEAESEFRVLMLRDPMFSELNLCYVSF